MQMKQLSFTGNLYIDPLLLSTHLITISLFTLMSSSKDLNLVWEVVQELLTALSRIM